MEERKRPALKNIHRAQLKNEDVEEFLANAKAVMLRGANLFIDDLPPCEVEDSVAVTAMVNAWKAKHPE